MSEPDPQAVEAASAGASQGVVVPPAAAVPPLWKSRYDRWLACPGSLSLEASAAEIPADDLKAFRELGAARARLPLQIFADGATAALMHLQPGSVCLQCAAQDGCPQERYNADDLV